MKASDLSVAIITWNEAERLRQTLESVAWVREIVVVDSGSTDKTMEIAREFTDKVLFHPWAGYTAQKNYALTQASSSWILSLDADEVVTPELQDEIQQVLAHDGPADGYLIPRKNLFLGRWIRHGRLYPDLQLRLFRRGRGAFRPAKVHEGVQVEGPVASLKAPLIHHSYQSVGDFVARADRYSTLAAEEALEQGRTGRLRNCVSRPLGRFASMYLLHRGFLDGRHGLLLALLYSYYVFLREAKLWEASGQRGRA